MELITGQFNDSFVPIMDGVTNVTKNYAYWLNKKYGRSFMITPAFPQYTDCEAFEVIRYHSLPLPKRPPYRFGIPQLDLSFKKSIAKIPFNIVHAHCPFGSGHIALQIAAKRGIPIVATFHSKYYDDFKGIFKNERLLQYFIKRIVDFYNSVDFVWTVNNSTVNTLRGYGYKGNIDVVYNGTDFTTNLDFEKNAAKMNKLLGLRNDVPFFLYTGQLILQKNLKMLVQSLHCLKKLGVAFKMVFAGTGYAENELKRLVKELGLEKYVIFPGAVLDRDYLKSLFARADLFLFPSVYDNAPIVIREAAAVKCPSLTVESSNASEGIIDNYNGFLSANDPMAYALKIKEIISDRHALSKAGEMAQKTIFKNWEQIIDEVRERYIDIIKTCSKVKRR